MASSIYLPNSDTFCSIKNQPLKPAGLHLAVIAVLISASARQKQLISYVL